MKIDKDKFPALFDKNIVVSKYEHLLDSMTLAKIKDVIEVSSTIKTYLAKTIIDPMLTNFKKLAPHRKELHDSCRTLIYVSKAGNPHTLHYVFLVEEDRINIMGQIYFIVPGGRDFGNLFSIYIDRLDTELLNFRSYPDIPPIIGIEQHDDILSVALSAILSAELFINFAEVETKVMKPNTQIWDEKMVNAIYNNKTYSDITVLDSTWYTNLISSGAFKVRGHFRLQPYGPGMKQKRLQWISEFKKEGYHRKAKIETA